MISFIFTQYTINQYLHNVQTVIIEPLAKLINNPDLLGGPVFCSWWQNLIHSGPLPGSNCPTLWLLHLSPLSHPPAHITLLQRQHRQSWSSLSGTSIQLQYLLYFFFFKWLTNVTAELSKINILDIQQSHSTSKIQPIPRPQHILLLPPFLALLPPFKEVTTQPANQKEWNAGLVQCRTNVW